MDKGRTDFIEETGLLRNSIHITSLYKCLLKKKHTFFMFERYLFFLNCLRV